MERYDVVIVGGGHGFRLRLRSKVFLPDKQQAEGQHDENDQTFGIHLVSGGMSGNRVVATAAPGVAAANAPERQPAALECAMLLHSLDRILRTGRLVATARRQPRTDGQLVEADQREDDTRHDDSLANRARKASTASGRPARSNGARTRTTKSTPAARSGCWRNVSRITRFM